MNKSVLVVPKGIRYISEWENYTLQNYQFPHILNKTLTGCGFTSDCITNNLNVILCSPRRILLENKQRQFPQYLLYVKNEVEKAPDFEKDLASINFNKPSLTKNVEYSKEEELDYKTRIMQLKGEVKSYWNSCKSINKPCKILVTYDSFRHVKEVLGGDIVEFYVVVDEFQSIFTDSKFKSDTELDFVSYLKDLRRVCFVSATPMLEKYLDMLDDFKDLPYYEMDWYSDDSARVIKPHLEVKYCGKRNTIQSNIKRIIEKYRLGDFDSYKYRDENGLLQEIQSKEAVIYVNSVKDIARVIKSCGLTYNECNVLASKNVSNEEIIRKAFGERKLDGIDYIGHVPNRGEPHKMFTLCTRTVYLGADFYSTCAKSYIFSNANIDCLSVDISMDLPQILGRQRLDCNPWKNSAELYVTLRSDLTDPKIFKELISEKVKKTESLLRSYNNAESRDKHNLADTYQKLAKTFNYRDNYVAVNCHSSRDLMPVFNNLVMVAEIRTFEIQEYDYANRFTLFSSLQNYQMNNQLPIFSEKIERIVDIFENDLINFVDRMKFICNRWPDLDVGERNILLTRLPDDYRNYLTVFSLEKISSCSYKKSVLAQEFNRIYGQQSSTPDLLGELQREFEIGGKYTKFYIKNKLREIYEKVNFDRTPKALDLSEWFELRPIQVTNPLTKKRDMAFEILGFRKK